MNICDPLDNFEFSQIQLTQPTNLMNGTYFTKIHYKGAPLYIQAPQAKSKQGFVKSGKKMYCDLVYENVNGDFLQWIEHLENRLQSIIYEKREKWFSNDLEQSDIENAFTQIVKVYKSGAYYLMRTNVNTKLGNPNILIYDESEKPVPLENVTDETSFMSILEIQGVRFSIRSFQVDIEIKQLMVLNTTAIYKECLIKKPVTKYLEETVTAPVAAPVAAPVDVPVDVPVENVQVEDDTSVTESLGVTEAFVENEIVEPADVDEKVVEENVEDEKVVEEKAADVSTSSASKDLEEFELVALDEEEEEEEDLGKLDIANEPPTFQLKSPDEIYYKFYRDAKEKAKKAKKEALLAYLEAENIKKTHGLVIDSDDDEDELFA